MNLGDIVVCGVTEDILLDDIKFVVPKGEAVTVPADLVVRSTDLYRQLSVGAIFQLNKNSRGLRPNSPPKEEPLESPSLQPVVMAAQVEIEALKSENARLAEENNVLQERVSVLTRESSLLKDSLGIGERLDQMMAMLKNGVAQGPSVLRTSNLNGDSFPSSEEAPVFIPSQIKMDDVDTSRLSTPESTETTSGAGVSRAANALRKLKVEKDKS